MNADDAYSLLEAHDFDSNGQRVLGERAGHEQETLYSLMDPADFSGPCAHPSAAGAAAAAASPAAPAAPVLLPPGARDWNAEFQHILEVACVMERGHRLAHFEQQFVAAASRAAQVAVLETLAWRPAVADARRKRQRAVGGGDDGDDEGRELPPLRDAGGAGGAKFVSVDGVFLKLFTGSRLFASAAAAEKAASAELRALNAVAACQAAVQLGHASARAVS